MAATSITTTAHFVLLTPTHTTPSVTPPTTPQPNYPSPLALSVSMPPQHLGPHRCARHNPHGPLPHDAQGPGRDHLTPNLPNYLVYLNVALLLVVAVYNLNPASFAYTRGGHTDVTYLNVEVGVTKIDPGTC
ncbi:hypothetical protein ZEAMMB73_Zm00001d043576 [Zea mays]|uniref:Uncharacterized protein n=1 Tax=Zea mays TaxID=4577 RepID=A0A1D6NDD5_MAIZE|nr:hypothetical protein ZEAMMB73_Zm00001d043576 [Zea mays]